ncbi:hypothetical protein ES703_114584 [subsurface metagenome]
MTIGEDSPLYIPAPHPAELSENVHLITVGEESWLNIPPPPSQAELLENLQLVTVGEDSLLYIPPPLVALPPVIVNPSSTVSEPTLSAVTTEPAPPPSMVVISAPAPKTCTPSFSSMLSLYVPAPTFTV